MFNELEWSDRVKSHFPKGRGFLGAQVGLGWHPIVEDLVKELGDLTPDFTIIQVKEKFGDLRFYSMLEDSDIDSDDYYNIITKYEHKAAKTCEYCGAPGEAREGSWYKTLCLDCYEDTRR